MTQEKQINISAEVLAMDFEAVAEFYRNRALIASQRYAEAAQEAHKLRETLAEEREAFHDATRPTTEGDQDSALSALLRAFVEEQAFGEAAYARLLADARRIISQEGE